MSRLDVLENDFWNAINSSPSEAERIANLMRDIQGPECELELADDGKCRHCGWDDATEWCEKTATEIYATSALPYPFPVDSEIYDH